jgi:hypothetical protein
VLSRSTLTDIGYLYFNIFVFGIVFGWALLSYEMLSRTIVDQLTALFGLMPPAPLPALASRTIVTVMLFLAYELGYWLNHYLSHRIAFLWKFQQGSPYGDGADAGDELPRPSGVYVHLPQHPRGLHRGRKRRRRVPLGRDHSSIRAL